MRKPALRRASLSIRHNAAPSELLPEPDPLSAALLPIVGIAVVLVVSGRIRVFVALAPLLSGVGV